MLFLSLVSTGAQSQATELAPQKALATPPKEQNSQLKFEALQELRDLVATDFAKNYPERSRVSLYLDVQIDTFVLQHIDLFIDGYEEPESRDYSYSEAAALLRYGTNLIYRSNFQPGSHYVRIEYSGQTRGSDKDSEVLSGSIELTFEVDGSAKEFILPVVPKALLPESTLIGAARPKIWVWEDATENPGLGYVRYLRDLSLEFESMQEMLRIAGPAAAPSRLPYGYYTLLAHVYLDFGMRQQAVAAARQAANEPPRPEISVPPGQTLVDVWLRIAELDYLRQDHQLALESLAIAEPMLLEEYPEYPEDGPARAQRLWWQDVKSRVLMAQGSYDRAAAILALANEALDDYGPNIYFAKGRSLYLRYNYALALFKSGRVAEGYTLFNRLGSQADPQGSDRVLRDRANLALAYDLLRAEQGATAKPIFQRLPLQGEYSNNALLGLGWCELAPPGKELEKASPGTYGLGLLDFVQNLDQAELGIGPAQKFERALIVWNELATRDPSEPAVQEVFLAIPYAMQQLGQETQSIEAYLRALNSYKQTANALQASVDVLRQNLLSDAIFYEDVSTVLPTTRWMDRLRATHLFQSYLDDYLDLSRLATALRGYEYSGEGGLPKRLDQAAQAQTIAAQSLVADEIDEKLARIESYRLEALVGLGKYGRLPENVE